MSFDLFDITASSMSAQRTQMDTISSNIANANTTRNARGEKEVYKKFVGNGGFNAYLGTNDMRDVEKMVLAGDAKATEIRDAFVFQVAKDIGSMATVLKGKVDAIVVTGGIAYDKGVVAGLKDACEWIAPFTVYPGEDELGALVQGGLRVLNGEEEAKVY